MSNQEPLRVTNGMPDEPTSAQCGANTQFTGSRGEAVACWYPQMGGYSSKCIVVSCGNNNPGEKPEEACFDIYIWHDGSFPFSDSGRSPTVLHHCDANQFIRFGETVIKGLTR